MILTDLHAIWPNGAPIAGILFDWTLKTPAAIVAELPLHCSALQSIPVAERKIALVVAYDFNDDAASANDAVAILAALKVAGYGVAAVPEDGKSLMRRLLGGTDAEETFARSDYAVSFALLPHATQDRVTAEWGSPERDPAFREGRLDCGAFAMRAFRSGAVIVALRPLSAGADPKTPSHGQIAFYHWLADSAHVDAIIDLGMPSGRRDG
jgi:cobaltochelatase CobN